MQLSPSLQGLGELHQAQGRLRDAIACYEQALPALCDAGFRHDEAEALGRLAELHADSGDHNAAQQARHAAEAVRRQASSAASGY